ncbi:hypothetical protein [Arthrobacter sp. ZGTC131]|uniref:hypothetical protein n=1 Tax=Arthrobacter sp. ZGTC131 TaxID=2058898 RepID=UPI0011B0C232|nr:hypothetical protein [Arthrobacter sp. ZGTC131]
MEALKTRASGATPSPGVVHPQKIRLVKVAFLGEMKQVMLDGDVTGYELGIEFSYKAGRADSRTDKRLCTMDPAFSSVELTALA